MAYDTRRPTQPTSPAHRAPPKYGQPASRTRFYRDKRNGKLWAFARASPTIPASTSRWSASASSPRVFMSGGSVLPLFHRRMDRPRSRASSPTQSTEEQQFWQGVRASPARAARDIRSRFRDIDRRLADIECYVTTETAARPRDRAAALADSKGGILRHGSGSHPDVRASSPRSCRTSRSSSRSASAARCSTLAEDQERLSAAEFVGHADLSQERPETASGSGC